MQAEPMLQKIRRYFSFLFERFGFDQVSETHFPEHFGNWVILLQSPSGRIRFLQDRGELKVALSPTWSPHDWNAGPWFELAVVVAYLTAGDLVPEIEYGSAERQLEQLAGIFNAHSEEILGLFHQDNFEEHRAALENWVNKLDDAFWSQLNKP